MWFYMKVLKLVLNQPENALTSIYVTASVPTDVAASPLYDCINFESCSDKAGGEVLKRSSSACEYSTLTLSKCPTNPTITQPSRPAEETLCSVINEPEPKWNVPFKACYILWSWPGVGVWCCSFFHSLSLFSPGPTCRSFPQSAPGPTQPLTPTL